MSLESIQRELKVDLLIPLTHSSERFQEFFDFVNAQNNIDFWKKLINILGVKTIFSQNYWSEFIGKQWILDKLEFYWLDRIKTSKFYGFGILDEEFVNEIIKEYKKRTYAGVCSLFNLVTIEIWLREQSD